MTSLRFGPTSRNLSMIEVGPDFVGHSSPLRAENEASLLTLWHTKDLDKIKD